MLTIKLVSKADSISVKVSVTLLISICAACTKLSSGFSIKLLIASISFLPEDWAPPSFWSAMVANLWASCAVSAAPTPILIVIGYLFLIDLWILMWSSSLRPFVTASKLSNLVKKTKPFLAAINLCTSAKSSACKIWRSDSVRGLGVTVQGP